MKRMGWDDQMRYLKTIDQVHVQTGEDEMIRLEILKQLPVTTYSLGKHYENVSELHNTIHSRRPLNHDDFILRTELSLTSPTETSQIQ